MRRKDLSSEFARVLRAEREAMGLSQEALAHGAGVHRTYVGLVERGLRNPTIQVAHQLAQVLGMSLSEMIRVAERRLK